jgi:DNA-binding MarR family transcriptional regulator
MYMEESHLSSDGQDQHTNLVGELVRELRQLQGLSASFVRAAAARMGVTVTDMQVIEGLTSTGPMTAGQLAELTGLTTGAITGMINRLEEAGLVRRERDPDDARRVIVQLAPDTGQMPGMGSAFDAIGIAWGEQIAQYDDEHIAFLTDFLKRNNAVTRQEINWLREAPTTAEGTISAPLGGLASGQLVVSGVNSLRLHGKNGMAELYRAQFDGLTPEVKVTNGVIGIRSPRRRWVLPGGHGTTAEVTLNASIPWRILVQGGASVVNAELGSLNLSGLELKGGMSLIDLDLPTPSSVAPIHISGGASQITIRRPAGVAARVHLQGWASAFVFDDQTFTAVGNNVRVQSDNYKPSDPHYDIEITSSASMVTITTS